MSITKPSDGTTLLWMDFLFTDFLVALRGLKFQRWYYSHLSRKRNLSAICGLPHHRQNCWFRLTVFISTAELIAKIREHLWEELKGKFTGVDSRQEVASRNVKKQTSTYFDIVWTNMSFSPSMHPLTNKHVQVLQKEIKKRVELWDDEKRTKLKRRNTWVLLLTTYQ